MNYKKMFRGVSRIGMIAIVAICQNTFVQAAEMPNVTAKEARAFAQVIDAELSADKKIRNLIYAEVIDFNADGLNELALISSRDMETSIDISIWKNNNGYPLKLVQYNATASVGGLNGTVYLAQKNNQMFLKYTAESWHAQGMYFENKAIIGINGFDDAIINGQCGYTEKISGDDLDILRTTSTEGFFFQRKNKVVGVKEFFEMYDTYDEYQDVKELIGGGAWSWQNNEDYNPLLQYLKSKAAKGNLSLTTYAEPSNVSIDVQGSKFKCNTYKIDGNNYFKIRDIAQMLAGTKKKFNIRWDKDSNYMSIRLGENYESVGGELVDGNLTSKKAVISTVSVSIYCDYIDNSNLPYTIYNIGGSNYFKLRDVAETLDFNLGWDEKTKTIKVNTTKSY